MSEKSAEMRHLEHEDFVRQLAEMRKEVGENDETIRDFIVRQADAFAEMRLELLKEVRGIEHSIASKCEQDSAIIGNVNRHEAALIRMQGEGSETAKALAVVTENMKALKAATDRDLKAAHDGIRETHGKIEAVGKRVEKLEHKGGKLALKILYGVAGVGGTAAITLWVKKLLGG
jgi:hypothetical protein